jgi:ABC-type polysaccharide/polyol phosphate export permease
MAAATSASTAGAFIAAIIVLIRRRGRRGSASRAQGWASIATRIRVAISLSASRQSLLAFSITAFGVMVAVRINQIQSFMGVMQLVIMPMFFISGALFPVTGLPGWLGVLNRLDPLTYAVEPMRVPLALEVFAVFGLGLAMLAIAIWEFSAGE